MKRQCTATVVETDTTAEEKTAKRERRCSALVDAQLEADVDVTHCPDCGEGPWCPAHLAAARAGHRCPRPGHAAGALQAAIDQHQAIIDQARARLAAVTGWKK